MLAKLCSWLLLLGLPAIAYSQTPPQIIRPVPAPNPQLEEAEQRLRQLIQSREELTKEIQRLQKLTGSFDQIVVSVKVYELSLDQAREVKLPQGFDAETIGEHGFRAILSSAMFAPGQLPGAAPSSDHGYESVVTQVVDNQEALDSIVAELEKAGALNVLARPTLVTVSGHPASLHIGGEFPIRVAHGNGDSVVEFKAYGTQLTLKPLVLGQQRIRLEVRPTFSEIEPKLSTELNGSKVPGLRIRGLNTQTEMRSGQTFVIAGLAQNRPIANHDPQPNPDATKDAATPEATETTELLILFRPEIVNPL